MSRDRLSSGQTQRGERPDRMSGLGVHKSPDFLAMDGRDKLTYEAHRLSSGQTQRGELIKI